MVSHLRHGPRCDFYICTPYKRQYLGGLVVQFLKQPVFFWVLKNFKKYQFGNKGGRSIWTSKAGADGSHADTRKKGKYVNKNPPGLTLHPTSSKANLTWTFLSSITMACLLVKPALSGVPTTDDLWRLHLTLLLLSKALLTDALLSQPLKHTLILDGPPTSLHKR